VSSDPSAVSDDSGVHFSDRDQLLPNGQVVVNRSVSLDSNATTQSEKDKDAADEKDKRSAYMMFVRLMIYQKQQWPYFALGFLFLFMYSLCELQAILCQAYGFAGNVFVPLYTGRVIASILRDGDHDELIRSILAVLGLSLAV
jgi:hypothetical protein